MMRIAWIACLVAFGCSNKKSSSEGAGSAAPAAAAAASSTTPAPAVVAKPCPEGDALVALVRAARKIEAGKSVDATCVAGKFGEPGWYIAAMVDRQGETTEQRGILATDGKRELVAFEVGVVPPARAEDALSRFEAHDLD